MNSRIVSVNVGLPRIVVWTGKEITTDEAMLGLFFIMASIGESFLDHHHVLVTYEGADDSCTTPGDRVYYKPACFVPFPVSRSCTTHQVVVGPIVRVLRRTS